MTAPKEEQRGASALPAIVARAVAHGDGLTEPLSDDERYYTERARAANTRRGYRSDLADFAHWCAAHDALALPASPTTVNGYLTDLVRAGAKISTLGRRLSSISFAHRFAGVPNPVDHPRVQGVWEGIRREHASTADQAPPLMPPLLWDVLGATPPPPDLSGLRDRALLLVGFIGALRRSELAAVEATHLGEHPRGTVLSIPRSKTDPYAEGQLVVLPYSSRPDRCPVVALREWLAAARIDEGPVFRPVPRGGKRALARGMDEGAINRAVQRACIRALGLDGRRFSAHSLRAGFATYASQRGASDRAIAHQTRHRSLGSLDQYIRHETAWADNAASALDL